MLVVDAREMSQLVDADIIDVGVDGIGDGVRRITEGEGVDIVIERFEALLPAVPQHPGGRRRARCAQLYRRAQGEHRYRQSHLEASAWQDSPIIQTPALKRKAWDEVTELIVNGVVVPIVVQTYPLEGRRGAPPPPWGPHPLRKVVLAL